MEETALENIDKASDVKYEIEETDTEVRIRYYWEDYEG